MSKDSAQASYMKQLTMTGSKYSYAITQLETHGVLHPDSHMFVQEDFYQSDPDVMAHIMTQLSLKNGLKQRATKRMRR
jgi:hypothetical protein